MLRVFSPTGLNIIFPEIKCSESGILWIKGFYGYWRGYLRLGELAVVVLNQDLQDFEDYRGRLCFDLEGYLKNGCFLTFFSPMHRTHCLLPDWFHLITSNLVSE
jgi:hypothetical protein